MIEAFPGSGLGGALSSSSYRCSCVLSIRRGPAPRRRFATRRDYIGEALGMIFYIMYVMFVFC
jgi:hypothetical protein